MKFSTVLISLLFSVYSFAQDPSDEKLSQWYERQMHYHYNARHEVSLQYFDSIRTMTDAPKPESLNIAFLSCESLINLGKKTSYADLQSKLDKLASTIRQANEGKTFIEDQTSMEQLAEESEVTPASDTLKRADVPPEFPGGMAAFYKYVAENMTYPGQARRLGVEGRVYVQFVITEEGKVTDVRTVKGIGAGCDLEAERIISESSGWIPGSIVKSRWPCGWYYL